MEVMELSQHIRGTATAVWKLPESPTAVQCWETKTILAAVEHCVYADGTVGTILPFEFSRWDLLARCAPRKQPF
eukprot:5867886-Pyramimonas_sp.AAC.1